VGAYHVRLIFVALLRVAVPRATEEYALRERDHGCPDRNRTAQRASEPWPNLFRCRTLNDLGSARRPRVAACVVPAACWRRPGPRDQAVSSLLHAVPWLLPLHIACHMHLKDGVAGVALLHQRVRHGRDDVHCGWLPRWLLLRARGLSDLHAQGDSLPPTPAAFVATGRTPSATARRQLMEVISKDQTNLGPVQMDHQESVGDPKHGI